MPKRSILAVAGFISVFAGAHVFGQALGTAITYQGRLIKNGVPVDSSPPHCTLTFSLWDAAGSGSPPVGGNQIDTTQVKFGVIVSDGLVVVEDLDFGADAFVGLARWLQIAVECPGDSGPTTLAPRVVITPVPHALALPGFSTQYNTYSPNILGGHEGNILSFDTQGMTISGGGTSTQPHFAVGIFGTIGGGRGNSVTDFSTVGGGDDNVAGSGATVAGGSSNLAVGTGSTIGGGFNNVIDGREATICGGEDNTAGGDNAIVLGGLSNSAGGDYSLASGRRARVRSQPESGDANGDEGTFVWADSTDADFISTGPNQFLIRAAGGVGIGTNAPESRLHVVDSTITCDDFGGPSGFLGRRANGTSSVPTPLSGGDVITTFGGKGYGSTEFSATTRGSMQIVASQTWTDTAQGTYLRFNATPNGTQTPTERMRILENGNVGIGTAAPTEKLDVTGNIHATGTIKSGSSITIDGASVPQRLTSTGALEFSLGTDRVYRWEPEAASTFGHIGPNIVGGWDGNSVTAGAKGATIAGGGGREWDGQAQFFDGPNRVTDSFGFVGGGTNNQSGNGLGTDVDASYAAIGGGSGNLASSTYAVVAGGVSNTANGDSASIGGGGLNTASGSSSVIGGGINNTASGNSSVVGGGSGNTASALNATVPGGSSNSATGTYSFAAGRRGKANHSGTFVWADSTAVDFASTNVNQFLIRADGGVGINTADPDVPLEIAGGSELTLTDGTGYFMIGDQDAANLAFDANEIQSRSNGVAADFYINGAGGEVGIGLTTPLNPLDVRGVGTPSGGAPTVDEVVAKFTNSTITEHAAIAVNAAAGMDAILYLGEADAAMWDVRSDSGDSTFDIRFQNGAGINGTVFTIDGPTGRVGIGDASPDARLDVESTTTSAIFNRIGSNGAIVELQGDGTTEGTITISGTTVSYNNFTGSHFGWADEPIERGTLVTLTGENKSYHGREGGEPIYGVVASTLANDPRCLGAYLGVMVPSEPVDIENPHQIMSVGNGEMWVVDTGRDIEPGDYLISSEVAGHAMLDDEDAFPVGYVVARASERVNWSSVTPTIDGRKHVKITVFFDSFVRGTQAVVRLERELKTLTERCASMESANRELHVRLAAMERSVALLAAARKESK